MIYILVKTQWHLKVSKSYRKIKSLTQWDLLKNLTIICYDQETAILDLYVIMINVSFVRQCKISFFLKYKKCIKIWRLALWTQNNIHLVVMAFEVNLSNDVWEKSTNKDHFKSHIIYFTLESLFMCNNIFSAKWKERVACTTINKWKSVDVVHIRYLVFSR